MLAAGHGSLAHVKLLVERGADIHTRDRLGDDAFNEAVSAREFDIANYLLEQGINLNNINHNGVTTAWGVQFTLSRLDPTLEHYAKLSRIQQKMIEKGIEFPAKPPSEVKEWMRSQGMYVIGDD